ncbi:androgen-dependent TFPI-regulating protein isoform X3 [Ambystoma mexicanum]|uniref:androgen-dependent TFPI-regulating protein isoform X3 n=1 Tax=Ambystoma mexicanum TaxID=8296 RepID=UPI0037E774C2
MAIPALTLYHFLTFAWYFFIMFSVSMLKGDKQPSGVFMYGGPWKYLTILNVVLQTIFYGVSFVADLLAPISKLGCVKLIQSCKDLLFTVLAFPVAMHTAIFPLTLMETLATPHRYPQKKRGLGLLGFFSFSYLCWVLWIYIAVGEWVYPLLGLLSPVGFLAFTSTSLVLIASIYIIGDIINGLTWGAAEARQKLK